VSFLKNKKLPEKSRLDTTKNWQKSAKKVEK